MTIVADSSAVKGTINKDITVEFALNLGKILGRHYGSLVAVAMDGRTSNEMLKLALASGLMSVGCDVIDLGIAPTPVLQYYLSTHPDVHGGVTVTASFAEQDQNGFRVMKSGGMDDPIFDDLSLDGVGEEPGECVPGPKVGERFAIENQSDGYIDAILSQVDVESISQAHLGLCLDCRNSAVAAIAAVILRRLSVECITLGGDGSALGTDRMVKLGHVVTSQNLDLGVALEMDADHCLFTTADGIPVSGDKSFAIIVKSVLSKKNGKVVIPINSTTLMEDVVRENEAMLMHCKVGEQNVARKVKEYEAVIGGDSFGCIVFPDHLYSSDGIMTMVRMLECIVKDGPLADQISGFADYHRERRGIECPDELIPEILRIFRENHSEENLDLIDGIKINYDDGWLLVRKSNSKGLIRIYAESKDPEESVRMVEETIQTLRKIQEGLTV